MNRGWWIACLLALSQMTWAAVDEPATDRPCKTLDGVPVCSTHKHAPSKSLRELRLQDAVLNGDLTQEEARRAAASPQEGMPPPPPAHLDGASLTPEAAKGDRRFWRERRRQTLYVLPPQE